MSPADSSTWARADKPARPNAQPLIELRDVRREFPAGDEVVVALKDISLTIESGEMVAIVGSSGSGKSTLMNILGCLDRPTRGTYRVLGRDTREMEPDDLAALRREHFGFIFQRYHLLPDLTAAGNVETPAIYLGRDPAERRAEAMRLLERLGLKDRAGHTPNQLSGGQQQRVSIARALINGGEVILADEPTGALDTTTGAEVMRILRQLNAEGRTIIIVTHDMKVAEHADRIIELSDGAIIADRRKPGTAEVAADVAPKSVKVRQGAASNDGIAIQNYLQTRYHRHFASDADNCHRCFQRCRTGHQPRRTEQRRSAACWFDAAQHRYKPSTRAGSNHRIRCTNRRDTHNSV